MEDPDASSYEEEHLYDLYADPYELENLIGAPEYREVADRMKERLLAHIHEVEGKEPTIKNAPERSVPGQRVVWPEEIDQ
jgi:hypothetical protein